MRNQLAILALAALAAPAEAQPKPKITVAIFAPSVEFGTATARLAYVQALAKAIEQNTGLAVEAQSYANLAALKKDNVDFAIIDGPCVATNPGWRLLATAIINGASARPYALYASTGTEMQALKGKRLAYVAAGCNDAGFIDNAMLESEVDSAFFGARVGKPDLTSAIAEVASVKAAHAVFAPIGAIKGLTKVFDTGAVPNPAFVAIDTRLPATTINSVASVVIGYGGAGALGGWTRPSRDLYVTFASRLRRLVKSALFATPEPVRIDAKDVLIEPPTIKDHAVLGVRQHFVRPSGDRLE
ncbi:MAG: hypothetical protein H0T89_09920 [Deltaproteobacteria bacterium]|nr:hypothetical protein [Deltaproteobacteria bacterium]MDQ3298118.1 hypothetical protein [Myxococcota bacterium]